MSYDVLRRSLKDGEGGGDNVEHIPLVEMDENGVLTETNESGVEDLELAQKEDPKESLISEEIDENGIARDYEVALKCVGFGLFHILLLAVNGTALSSDAVEVLSISFVLPIIREKDEFDMADWQSALLSSIIFLGMLIGGYLWGGLSDLSGRRHTVLMSLTLNGIFGLASAFAPNFSVFLFFRFVSGIGVGGSLPVIFSYMSEFIRNKYRGPYLGIQSTFWMLGTLLCGAFAWIIVPRQNIQIPMGDITITSWRVFIAVSAAPSLIGALLYFILPESPRFLLEVGKEEKALKALRLAYRLNHLREKNKEFPVKGVQVQDSNTADLAGVLFRSNSIKGFFYKLREILKRTADLFNRKLRKRTLLLFVVIFCLSFGSYGVVLWYPSYVRIINDEKDAKEFKTFCNQTISNTTIDAAFLRKRCGCRDIYFEDVEVAQLDIRDWNISGSFRNVVFHDVKFSNVLFHDSEFIDCVMNETDFNSVYFIETKWRGVTLEDMTMTSVEYCGFSAQTSRVDGTFVLTDVTINGEYYNQTTFSEVLDNSTTSATCSKSQTRKIENSLEIECQQEYDDRVYRDNFVIAASAFPGNMVSAIAVYFFRRNYWMACTLLTSTATAFLLYVVHSEVFVVVVLCIFTAVSTPAWNDSSLLIAELYPTHVRSTAMGVHLLMARIGAIAGTNIFGEFVYVDPSIPILLVACVLCVGGLSAIPLPKTTRKTLLS